MNPASDVLSVLDPFGSFPIIRVTNDLQNAKLPFIFSDHLFFPLLLIASNRSDDTLNTGKVR